MDENSYMSNEEFEEFVAYAKELFENRSNSISTINLDRVHDMVRVYNVVKEMTKDTSANVNYKIEDPSVGLGVVSAECETLVFNSPKKFTEAVTLADNFNVYPKTNGKVHMDFALYNMTVKVH